MRVSVVSVAILACVGLLAAQDPRPRSDQAPVFRAQTDLALVRFQVIRSDRYVGGLTAADIRVFDNGVERPVDWFEGGCGAVRTRPIDIALLFDLSGSVTNRGLLDWVVYRDTFIRALAPSRIAVYGFSDALSRFCEPTSDPERLRDALQRVVRSTEDAAVGATTTPLRPPKQSENPDNKSWIYEAIVATAREPSAPAATRVILLVSDGNSTTGARADDVLEEVQRLGVSVFPLFVGHRESKARGAYLQQWNLARFAESTGGRSFDPFAFDAPTVKTALAIVAETIRCEYVVGIVPAPSSTTPIRHTLEVRLRSKDLGTLWGGKRVVHY